MDKIYTLKQVLFALRKEYVEVQKQLNELNKYVSASNKVKSCNFYLRGNPCNVYLYLEKKKNLLEKIGFLAIPYIYESELDHNVSEKIEKEYYYYNKEMCSITDTEKLKETAKKIIHTDFAKNIVENKGINMPCVEKEFSFFSIRTGDMTLINGINAERPFFRYFAPKDILQLINEKRITCDDIFNILNIKLNGNCLSEYYYNILDNYEEKAIEIDDKFNSKVADIEIIEEPKKLILRPTRISKKIGK